VAETKRRSFETEEYWGRPVPNFGDPKANGLIVGLAPAAHGANRTGRMFTGDRSGDWLYRALFRAGLASQPEATGTSDGLTLNGILISAICHCAPPDNRPTPGEIVNCRRHLEATLALRPFRAILCLGALAWEHTFRALGKKIPCKFGHGISYKSESNLAFFASYHPSQQNTFTGRLTESMLDEVIEAFAARVR